MFGAKSSCETKTELTPVRKDGHQGKSRFKKDREKVTDSTVNRNEIDLDILDTETESKVQAEQKPLSGNVLERSFKMLSVADDVANNVHSVQPKHFYEIAEERAKQNAGEMKQLLKLNRYCTIVRPNNVRFFFFFDISRTNSKTSTSGPGITMPP